MDISLRVPRLTAFSIEAVHTFVDDYEAYIACGGRAHPRVMTASSLLVVLVAKSKGKIDVGQCDEKELWLEPGGYYRLHRPFDWSGSL